MKSVNKVFDKARFTYEVDLPFSMSVEAVMAWVKIMSEQMIKSLPSGQRFIEIIPILKKEVKENKNESN